MNKKLFTDLSDILIYHGDEKLTRIHCFDFFTASLIPPDERNIRNIINGKRSLPQKVYQLQSDHSWNLADISCKATSKQLTLELCNLYKHYICTDLPTDGISSILDDLIRTCLFDKPNPEKKIGFAPSQTLIQYKPNTFYGRKTELQKIHNLLQNYGKLIIKGSAGIGKTMFSKQYHHTYKKDYTESTFIVYNENIQKTLLHIKFKEDFRFSGTYSEIVEQLQQKTSHSLLIIDSMNCPPEQFAQEISILSSLPLHIIITAHEYVPTDTVTAYNLMPLDFKEQQHIFYMHNPEVSISSTDLSRLFQLLSNNTLAVSLISKSFSKIKVPLEQLILHFEQPNFKKTSDFPEIKHGYTKHEYNYFGHISTIYYQLDLSDNDREILKQISIFYDCVLPIFDLQRWIPEITKIWISKMFSLGIISYYSSTCIQIHPLISDAIFYKEKPSICNCEGLMNRIHSDIKCHFQNLYMPDMQNIISCVLNRLKHTSLSNLSSDLQKQWWLFIADSVRYMLDCNNSVKAFKFLDELEIININIPESTFIIGLKLYLKIYASWIVGDIESKNTSIDNLLSWIKKDNIEYFHPIMSLYLPLELDKIIYDTILLNQIINERYTLFHNIYLQCQTLSLNKEMLNNYSYIDDILNTFTKRSFQRGDLNILMETLHKYANFIGNTSDPFSRISGICFLIFIQFTLIQKFLKNDTDTTYISVLLFEQKSLMDTLDSLVESYIFLPSYIAHICIAAYYYLPISFPIEKNISIFEENYYSLFMENLEYNQNNLISICSEKIKQIIRKSPITLMESQEIQKTLNELNSSTDVSYILLE